MFCGWTEVCAPPLDSLPPSPNASPLDHATPESQGPSPTPAPVPTSPPGTPAVTPAAPGAPGQPFLGPRPAPRPTPMHPRRVRGGVRLSGGIVEGPTLWAAQRWMRVVEIAAAGANLTEGLEYAKLGQTKRVAVTPGRVEAAIQGRADRPYLTQITFGRLTDAEWERVAHAMAEGAMYSAKLLAGELPSNIEDAFGPLNLRLFPSEPAHLTVSCTCADFRTASEAPQQPVADPRWCKHVCCLSHLLAGKLANEALLIFALRGLEGAELLERLRDQRASAAVAPGDRVPVYQQHVPGITDLPVRTLEESIASFWDAGAALDTLDLPLDRPKLSHPLLRRLGPSPLSDAPFPLVGLLASCYDVISDEALRRSTGTPADEPGTPATE